MWCFWPDLHLIITSNGVPDSKVWAGCTFFNVFLAATLLVWAGPDQVKWSTMYKTNFLSIFNPGDLHGRQNDRCPWLRTSLRQVNLFFLKLFLAPPKPLWSVSDGYPIPDPKYFKNNRIFLDIGYLKMWHFCCKNLQVKSVVAEIYKYIIFVAKFWKCTLSKGLWDFLQSPKGCQLLPHWTTMA